MWFIASPIFYHAIIYIFQYGSHNELEQNNNGKSVENIERYSSEDLTALKEIDEKQYLKRYTLAKKSKKYQDFSHFLNNILELNALELIW